MRGIGNEASCIIWSLRGWMLVSHWRLPCMTRWCNWNWNSELSFRAMISGLSWCTFFVCTHLVHSLNLLFIHCFYFCSFFIAAIIDIFLWTISSLILYLNLLNWPIGTIGLSFNVYCKRLQSVCSTEIKSSFPKFSICTRDFKH